MGRGIFAKEDLPKDVALFSEKPLLMVSARDDVCKNCFGPLPVAKVLCGHCAEDYCCEKCKNSAWDSYHSPSCGRTPPDITNALQQIGGTAKLILAATKLYGVTMLDTEQRDTLMLPQFRHYRAALPEWPLSLSSLIQSFWAVESSLHLQFDPRFDFEWFLRIHALLMCNSFNATPFGETEFAKTGGSAMVMYQLTSFMNHSCSPNAKGVYSRDFPRVTMTTSENIPKGEQIFIKYIDTSRPKRERQIALKRTYGFECKCSKCQSEI